MSAPLPDADADVSPVRLTAALESRTQKTRACDDGSGKQGLGSGGMCRTRSRLRARVGTHRAAVRAAGGDVRVERRDASGRRVGHDSCGSWEGEARRFVTTERIDELTIIKPDTRLSSVRGYLERGAIWNSRQFAHRGNCIFFEHSQLHESYERAPLLLYGLHVLHYCVVPSPSYNHLSRKHGSYVRNAPPSRVTGVPSRTPVSEATVASAARHAAAAAGPRRAASNCSVTRSCSKTTRASERASASAARAYAQSARHARFTISNAAP